MIVALCEQFGIAGRVREAALAAYERAATFAYDAQERVHINVLRAFLDEGMAESDLAGSTGYGYDDAARAHYESLLARVLGAERAIARLSIVSGTHAIVAAIAACTPPGQTLLSISGTPYDTLPMRSAMRRTRSLPEASPTARSRWDGRRHRCKAR